MRYLPQQRYTHYYSHSRLSSSIVSILVSFADYPLQTQLKDALDQCTHLKEVLVSTQDELVAARMAVTELTEKHAHEVSALKAQAVELVAKNEETLKSPASAELKSSMSEEVCDECAHLSAEVVRYQAIIASTEDALSHLQRSVGQEEERWRLALQKCCEENTLVSQSN